LKAYIIATQVNQIFSKFVTNIIYPVVNKITENIFCTLLFECFNTFGLSILSYAKEFFDPGRPLLV
jgi:large-conductance mechanosensitive channel